VSRILINKARQLLSSQIWPLLKWKSSFKAAGAEVKIGLSLKPNNRKEMKLAQIRETLCMLSEKRHTSIRQLYDVCSFIF